MMAKKLKAKSYNIEILYDNLPFEIQTPLCTIEKIIREGNEVKCFDISFTIQSNFTYYKFFNIFDLRLKKFIENFNDKHNIIQLNIEETFKGGQDEFETEESIKLCIHLKVNQETIYFDKNKKCISVHDLKEQDKVVGLIKTKGVFMDTKGINYRWTGNQILKFNN